MLPAPLHQLPEKSVNLTQSSFASSNSASLVPALLRRLADPGQGAAAALAFLCLHAAQRGAGWTHQAFPPLIDWLAGPYVAPPPYASPASVLSCGTPSCGHQPKPVGASRGQSPGGVGGGYWPGRTPARREGGLALAPRALSLPPHLQSQLRRLLAALPRCPKLYDSLDDYHRLLLWELLAALPRRSIVVADATAAHVTAAATAASRRGACNGSGSGGGRPPAVAVLDAESRRRRGRLGAWFRAALEASRLYYQPPMSPPPPPPPPPQPPPAPASGGAIVPMGAVPSEQHDSGQGSACGADAGWWWIRDLDPDLDLVLGTRRSCALADSDKTPLAFKNDASDLNPDLDPGTFALRTPGAQEGGAGAFGAGVLHEPGGRQSPWSRHGAGNECVLSASNMERLELGGGRKGSSRATDDGLEGRGAVAAAAAAAAVEQTREGKEALEEEDVSTGATISPGARPPPGGPRTCTTRCRRDAAEAAAADPEEEKAAATGPPAKRLRTGALPPSPPPPAGDGACGSGGLGSGASLTEIFRLLQEAISSGDQAVPSEAIWGRLENLLEQCAASCPAGAGAVPPLLYNLGAAIGADRGALAFTGVAAAFPGDAVRHIVRQLVTPRLSGAAARLLLGVVVLPAVAAVERVMPRPLQEALAAAGSLHPRPLTEAVLVPAVQRPQLTPGQAQLLVKAVTAGRTPLPSSLQALVLRAAAASGSDWCDPHVTVVQGLVDAAKQELDEGTLGLLCQGLCAAVQVLNQHNHPSQPPLPQQQQHKQQHMTRSLPLCRLLWSLVSKYGSSLNAVQLQQLREAAAATSTFLTAACLTKLRELTTAGGGAGGAGAAAAAGWSLR